MHVFISFEDLMPPPRPRPCPFFRESIKRGMIRYLYLAIDLSKSMSEGDLRPSRLAVTLRIVQDFISSYFDQNPLSQLGILVTR